MPEGENLDKATVRCTDATRTQAAVYVSADGETLGKPFPWIELPEGIRKEMDGAGGNLEVLVRGRKAKINGKWEIIGVVSSCDPALVFAKQTGNKTSRLLVLKDAEFQVTDRALALRTGHVFRDPDRGQHPGRVLSDLKTTVPGAPGPPDVNRNPYNFVSLPGGEPWLDVPDPAAGGKHAGHDRWWPELLQGEIGLTLTALTPVFIPAGFPFPSDNTTLRPFFKLRGSSGSAKVHAIPGSSVKGPLRAMVEAVANDRFGVANEEEYGRRIPYRRRAFNRDRRNGSFEYHFGKVVRELSNGDLEVRPMGLAGRPVPCKANLLARDTDDHTRGNPTRTREPVVTLPKKVREEYERNIEHPHYAKYLMDREEALKDWKKKGPHAPKPKPSYRQDLPSLDKARDDLRRLDPGEQIFYTLDRSGRIDSFGKNVNYLWPAERSIRDLAPKHFPPERRGLGYPLGLAERMFGFESKHQKEEDGKPEAHPFRGKLRFETFWCASEPTEVRLSLAPLTSPGTHAKSRPMYLVGRDGDVSASYSDKDPKLRGRKFYWRQRLDSAPDGIWEMHKKQEPLHKASQCPARIQALAKDAKFTGRIHFENLSRVELGALLFALTGAATGNGAAPTGNSRQDAGATANAGAAAARGVATAAAREGHTIQLGKGKPRGLGTFEPSEVKISFRNPKEEYGTLLPQPQATVDGEMGRDAGLEPGAAPAPQAATGADEEVRTAREAFEKWCLSKPGAPAGKGFREIDHIKDFIKLHTWPEKDSVRYYPLHFSDYSWLPGENMNPDEPKGGIRRRPKAMKQARDLEP